MEIHRLHEMLTGADIEHEFLDRTPPGCRGRITDWGYQVIVYRPDGERLVSAIEGYGTYGYGRWFDEDDDSDLIEIMGLLKPGEGDGSVVGYLTADDVFQRIKEAVECMK